MDHEYEPSLFEYKRENAGNRAIAAGKLTNFPISGRPVAHEPPARTAREGRLDEGRGDQGQGLGEAEGESPVPGQPNIKTDHIPWDDCHRLVHEILYPRVSTTEA